MIRSMFGSYKMFELNKDDFLDLLKEVETCNCKLNDPPERQKVAFFEYLQNILIDKYGKDSIVTGSNIKCDDDIREILQVLIDIFKSIVDDERVELNIHNTENLRKVANSLYYKSLAVYDKYFDTTNVPSIVKQMLCSVIKS